MSRALSAFAAVCIMFTYVNTSGCSSLSTCHRAKATLFYGVRTFAPREHTKTRERLERVGEKLERA